MRQSTMYAKFNPSLLPRTHKKGQDKWSAWFRRVMRVFRQTNATILSCTVEDGGHLRIHYEYGGNS